MQNQDEETKKNILADYNKAMEENKNLTPEERAKLVEDDEDAYFEEMAEKFR